MNLQIKIRILNLPADESDAKRTAVQNKIDSIPGAALVTPIQYVSVIDGDGYMIFSVGFKNKTAEQATNTIDAVAAGIVSIGAEIVRFVWQ